MAKVTATIETVQNVDCLKNTKISVFVDEALPDILVVTYEYGVQIFKGVLLDTTKKNLPCGIQNLHPAFKAPPTNDEDALYTVNQRFTYLDQSGGGGRTSPVKNKRHLSSALSSKVKHHSKMTVRLRPRQVLCSKCKAICTENSENVSRSKRRFSTSKDPTDNLNNNNCVSKRSANAPITRSVCHKLLSEGSLVPHLTRLTLQQELSATAPLQQSKSDAVDEETLDGANSNTALENIDTATKKRILRKKRSVGSMEDLWDESILEDSNRKNLNAPIGDQQQQQTVINNNNNNTNTNNNNNVVNTTRTIKICYGPQGEGTVLKIAAHLDGSHSDENLDNDDDDEDSNDDDDDDDDSEENMTLDKQKSVRKALRKARKEAKKRVICEESTTTAKLIMPSSSICSSPRYTVGSASPRHGLGNNSPRYMCNFDNLMTATVGPRKKKHKMKHKKRHKEDRKHNRLGEVTCNAGDVLVTNDMTLTPTHKLSINLKKLKHTYGHDVISDKTKMDDDETTNSSDEQVPDFPTSSTALLHLSRQTLSSAQTADGGRMVVGDVVWGKVHGFPWWPGKVLTITGGATNQQTPQAHVSWYGSATSSLMRCDQLSLYLENFKIRHNKKKRGPYKEAIKQATLEAKENQAIRLRQPLAASPGHNNILVPPALASPREIDVAS